MPTEISLVLNVSAFCIGACIGSFLNVCIWRIPRNESLVSPPSHCPSCNQPIKCYENIPIISWLLLRGKCSNCRTSIACRYLIIEVITAILFLLCWRHIWTNALPISSIVPYGFLTASLIAIAIIDIEHQRIPNLITFTGLFVAIVWCVSFPRTHFPAGVYSGEMFRYDPIMLMISDTLQHRIPEFAPSPRFLAASDAGLGILVGGGLLLLFARFMKFIAGKRHVKTDKPVLMTITATEMKTNGEQPVSLHDLFRDRQDHLQVFGRVLDYSVSGQEPVFINEANDESNKILVTDTQVTIRGHRIPISRLNLLRIETDYWIEPREVMGMGDIKLMAMIGAFLGPSAALIILTLSSISGTLFGALRALVLFSKRAKNIPETLPFGPFIAITTIAYLLLWPRLLNIIWHATRLTF